MVRRSIWGRKFNRGVVRWLGSGGGEVGWCGRGKRRGRQGSLRGVFRSILGGEGVVHSPYGLGTVWGDGGGGCGVVVWH
ncbi:hypothetical protein SOVF_181710 [Spinacia oleracea]|nr:hypothetical protein SOVF_181710 [Spinacia oleracea]